MRNKSAFTKPVIQNSFRKSSRIYPKSISIAKNDIGVYQKPLVKMGDQSVHLMQKMSSNKRLHVIPNHENQNIKERYYIFLQQAFPIRDRSAPTTYIDNTCIWFKRLDNSIMSKQQRFITLLKTDYTISNWTGDQYPNSLSICVEGFSGYLDKQGISTDRVAILQLQQALPSYQNDIRNYQIHYRIRQSNRWKIPSELTELKFYILIDNQNDKVQLPLPNPITLQIQIEYA